MKPPTLADVRIALWHETQPSIPSYRSATVADLLAVLVEAGILRKSDQWRSTYEPALRYVTDWLPDSEKVTP